MLIYAFRRIGLGRLILLVAMIMLFSMVYLVPGDPAAIALGPRATPEMKDALRPSAWASTSPCRCSRASSSATC